MARHIGNFLKREYIELALQKAAAGERKLRDGTIYAILYEGQKYGPKAVADYAIELEGKIKSEEYYRHGANTFHHFFKELGFEVVDRDGNPLVEEPPADRITRLCFNTANWTEPTGPEGKSAEGHEGEFGYGHEEWLFDLSRLIDGYHYGFIEGFRNKTASYEGQTMNLRFYTIDGRDKKRYWAGRITGLEVIGTEEAEAIREEYERLGWLVKMNAQLIEIQQKIEDLDPVGFSNYQNLQFFNIKFKPEGLDRTSIGRLIPKESKIMKWQQYNINKELPELLAGVPKVPTPPTISDEPHNPRASTIYTPSGEPVEMRFIHEEMSIALARELQQYYKEGTVTREEQAGFDSREVDIVVKNGKETIFYEIKTNLTLPIAIRAAIGQLMEYCHWSQEIRADHWIIVTQPFIDTRAAEFYLQHLRSLYKLPVYLQTFDHVTGALTELLPKSAFHNRTGNPCFL